MFSNRLVLALAVSCLVYASYGCAGGGGFLPRLDWSFRLLESGLDNDLVAILGFDPDGQELVLLTKSYRVHDESDAPEYRVRFIGKTEQATTEPFLGTAVSSVVFGKAQRSKTDPTILYLPVIIDYRILELYAVDARGNRVSLSFRSEVSEGVHELVAAFSLSDGSVVIADRRSGIVEISRVVGSDAEFVRIDAEPEGMRFLALDDLEEMDGNIFITGTLVGDDSSLYSVVGKIDSKMALEKDWISSVKRDSTLISTFTSSYSELSVMRSELGVLGRDSLVVYDESLEMIEEFKLKGRGRLFKDRAIGHYCGSKVLIGAGAKIPGKGNALRLSLYDGGKRLASYINPLVKEDRKTFKSVAVLVTEERIIAVSEFSKMDESRYFRSGIDVRSYEFSAGQLCAQ